MALLLVAYGAVSGVCDPLPSGQATVFVALGLLVGSRVLDKERPAQTLLGVRCHGDLSHPPWPDGGSGVALGSPSGGPFIQAGAGRRVGDGDAA
jgi:hypothetical protein